MSCKDEIRHTLVFLTEEAYAEQFDALLPVNVRRHNDGRPFTTCHLLLDSGTSEQTEKLLGHLQGIGDLLREIYSTPVEEVKG